MEPASSMLDDGRDVVKRFGDLFADALQAGIE